MALQWSSFKPQLACLIGIWKPKGYGLALLIKDTAFPPVPPLYIRRMWRHGKAQPQAPLLKKYARWPSSSEAKRDKSLHKGRSPQNDS